MTPKIESSSTVKHLDSGFSSMRVNQKTRLVNWFMTLLYFIPAIIGLVISGFLTAFLIAQGLFLWATLVGLMALLIFGWFVGLALAQSKYIELHDALNKKISFFELFPLALNRAWAMERLIALRLFYFKPRYSLAPFALIDLRLSPKKSLALSASLIQNKGFGKQYAAITTESLVWQTLTNAVSRGHGSAISSSAAANILAQKYVQYRADQLDTR